MRLTNSNSGEVRGTGSVNKAAERLWGIYSTHSHPRGDGNNSALNVPIEVVVPTHTREGTVTRPCRYLGQTSGYPLTPARGR